MHAISVLHIKGSHRTLTESNGCLCLPSPPPRPPARGGWGLRPYGPADIMRLPPPPPNAFEVGRVNGMLRAHLDSLVEFCLAFSGCIELAKTCVHVNKPLRNDATCPHLCAGAHSQMYAVMLNISCRLASVFLLTTLGSSPHPSSVHGSQSPSPSLSSPGTP